MTCYTPGHCITVFFYGLCILTCLVCIVILGPIVFSSVFPPSNAAGIIVGVVVAVVVAGGSGGGIVIVGFVLYKKKGGDSGKWKYLHQGCCSQFAHLWVDVTYTFCMHFTSISVWILSCIGIELYTIASSCSYIHVHVRRWMRPASHIMCCKDKCYVYGSDSFVCLNFRTSTMYVHTAYATLIIVWFASPATLGIGVASWVYAAMLGLTEWPLH